MAKQLRKKRDVEKKERKKERCENFKYFRNVFQYDLSELKMIEATIFQPLRPCPVCTHFDGELKSLNQYI